MKRLKPVSLDKVFYVFEGGTVNSLYQLADALSAMPAKSFSHHVSAVKNDFANWVRDVIDDSELALKLSLQKTRGQMESAVRGRIKELEAIHMPANASKSILRRGVVDFVIGLVVGVVAGLIIASLI